MELKTVYDGQVTRELEKYGITVLTGEACGIGLRLLCDLTVDGRELLTVFLGGCTPAMPNWNPGAIRSAMLSWSTLKDLLIFALTRDYDEVRDYGTYLVAGEGLQPGQSRLYRKSSAPGTGMRNQHAMSGRTD